MILKNERCSYEGLRDQSIPSADGEHTTSSSIATSPSVAAFAPVTTIAVLGTTTASATFTAIAAVTTITTGQINN